MAKKLKLWVAGFVLVAFFVSCQSQKLTTTTQFPVYENGAEMVAAAKKVITEIRVEDLKKDMDDDRNFYLIDVRTAGEYNDGNIPGSVSIPRGVLEFLIQRESFWKGENRNVPEKTSPVILYCRSGNRSALATLTLMELGFRNVKSLEGGWKAWQEIQSGAALNEQMKETHGIISLN